MKTKLLKHQKKAFDKLKKFKVGALLMDMGTGKTRVTLELINHKKDIDYVLWFTPCSTKFNLKKEIIKHSDYSLEIVSNQIKSDEFIKIIGTESIGMSKKLYKDVGAFVKDKNIIIVIDESSYIKGWRSNRTKRLTKIGKDCQYRYILNGTPITLGYIDLFPQYFFLSPSIMDYQSFYTFAKNHLIWDEKKRKWDKVYDVEKLVDKIAPYTFQIKQEECFDLPPKQDYYFNFELTDAQKQDYFIVNQVFAEIENPRDIDFYTFFGELQKITSGFDYKDNNRSSLLLDVIKQFKDKKIMWINYTKEGDEIKNIIKDHKIFSFYGSNRNKQDVEDFLDYDKKAILLINLKSGYGWNFQSVQTSIFYGSTFNFALIAQSLKRIYRYGQTKTTNIVYIYAEDTIDEIMKDNLDNKAFKLKDLIKTIKAAQSNENVKNILGKKFETKYIAPLNFESRVKPGDIYQLGSHRLMCGNSINKSDIDKLMDGKKANMVFTDPPYGFGLDTDYSKMGEGGNYYPAMRGDGDEFSNELITTIFDNFRYVQEMFIWGGNYFAEVLENKNDGSWITWDKRVDENLDKMWGSAFELCWSKNKHKQSIARIKWGGYLGLKSQDIKRFHPCQKPLELILWFLEKWGTSTGICVDLYGGSGSTLIACEKLNKPCYMMELDEYYCGMIIDRWEKFTGKKVIKVEK